MSKEQIVSGLELSKLFATALRDMALPLLIALLVLWPGFIKGRLTEAGFRKGSIGGMEWQAFNEADEQLKAARMQLNDLREQLRISNRTLAETRTPQARDLIVANTEVARSAETTVRAVSQQIAANQEVVQEADAPTDSSSGWAVVFGGDSTRESAIREIRGAIAAQIPEPQVILRRGSYRSVALFSDERTARRYLGIARQRIRPDSYLVQLGSWCPERRQRDDIQMCL